MFQSPRSGKFVSNRKPTDKIYDPFLGFNPLDRGKLYLIQIIHDKNRVGAGKLFQSPRSGKFVSDNLNFKLFLMS